MLYIPLANFFSFFVWKSWIEKKRTSTATIRGNRTDYIRCYSTWDDFIIANLNYKWNIGFTQTFTIISETSSKSNQKLKCSYKLPLTDLPPCGAPQNAYGYHLCIAQDSSFLNSKTPEETLDSALQLYIRYGISRKMAPALDCYIEGQTWFRFRFRLRFRFRFHRQALMTFSEGCKNSFCTRLP